MWYDFFLGGTFRRWSQEEKDEAIVDLKIHMMRLEKEARAYDVKGIDAALIALGFHVEAERVKLLWSRLKEMKGPDVGHAMEALAEDICDHVSFDQRRAALSLLWPAASYNMIPDEKEEAVFDRVASLLGFSDKNFLDSCIKHRMARNWELSESEVHCVVAELLMCMMWADGRQHLQEYPDICRIIAHGFQMDVAVVQQMLTGLDALNAKFTADHADDPDHRIGLERFEQERHAKIDMLAGVTELPEEDVERKFHVLIDVAQFDQMNIKRRVRLLVEKLRYSLDDYGYERLLGELEEIASADGHVEQSEESLLSQVKVLLSSLERTSLE